MKDILLFTILLYTLLSCKNSTSYKEKIREWQNKTIYIPKDIKMIRNVNKEYIHEIATSDFKVLTYIDSFNCTACKLKLWKWKQFIAETRKLNKKVCFLFVINSKNYVMIDSISIKNEFYDPLIYDKSDRFNRINKFPKESIFQTFLINKQNKVLILGNPVENENLWRLYLKVINSNS